MIHVDHLFEITTVQRNGEGIHGLDPDLVPDFVSLEGYIAGRLVIAALKIMGPDVTREGLLSTIKDTGQFDLGGIKLTYGPNDNQGMDI